MVSDLKRFYSEKLTASQQENTAKNERLKALSLVEEEAKLRLAEADKKITELTENCQKLEKCETTKFDHERQALKDRIKVRAAVFQCCFRTRFE